jgi:hypothetical protein
MTTQQVPELGQNEYSIDGSGDVGLDQALENEQPLESSVLLDEPVADVVAEPPESNELAQLRAENTRLTQESRVRQQEADNAKLQNAAAQYAESRIQGYVSQGYDEATARQIGVLEAREQVNAWRAEQAELRSNRIEMSVQYGVPQEQLLGFNDESAMRHYAEQYANTTGPQAKRMDAMERELAAFRKGQIPAQPYASPVGAQGGGNAQAIWDAYGRGELSWSDPRVPRAGKALGYRYD